MEAMEDKLYILWLWEKKEGNPTFMQRLLCVRFCARAFLYISSFNLHDSPMK